MNMDTLTGLGMVQILEAARESMVAQFGGLDDFQPTKPTACGSNASLEVSIPLRSGGKCTIDVGLSPDQFTGIPRVWVHLAAPGKPAVHREADFQTDWTRQSFAKLGKETASALVCWIDPFLCSL